MNPLQLDLPSDAEVYNFLYRTRESEYLVQDQLSAELPNGFVIDVAWTPEHDPGGQYVIRVFHEYWHNQRANPIITRSVDDVVAIVEQLARHYSQPNIPISASSTTVIVGAA